MISYVLLRDEPNKFNELNLNSQFISEWAELEAIDRKNGDCLRCPICGNPISMKQWLPPHN